MEGVGARLGRSSTRYGPSTVFTGPVRKWKKKWVHVSPYNKNGQKNPSYSHSRNGSVNGNNVSHLVLYKWTPILLSNNGSNNGDRSSDAGDEDAAVPEEAPRRKFKYIPMALLEDHKIEDEENEAAEMEVPKNEAAQEIDDEAKPSDTNTSSTGRTSKTNDGEEKPEINDVTMEENQDNNKKVGHLNESTLDLSLALEGPQS